MINRWQFCAGVVVASSLFGGLVVAAIGGCVANTEGLPMNEGMGLGGMLGTGLGGLLSLFLVTIDLSTISDEERNEPFLRFTGKPPRDRDL